MYSRRSSTRTLARRLLPYTYYTRARAVYWGVRLFGQRIRRICRSAGYVWRVYQLAETRTERISVIRFWLTALVSPRSTADAPLLFRGVAYTVGRAPEDLMVFNEIYGEHDYDLLDDFIPSRGSTVLDIGANIGLFAVLQAQRGAQVYACEPNPDCFRRLVRTLERNGLTHRVTVRCCAVGAVAGTGSLSVSDQITVGGRVITDVIAGCTIPILPLDQIVDEARLGTIDLLKIDVEGYEVEVLRGAQRSLTQVERLIVEYHGRDMLEQTLPIIERQGFVVAHRVDTNSDLCYGVVFARNGRLLVTSQPARD